MRLSGRKLSRRAEICLQPVVILRFSGQTERLRLISTPTERPQLSVIWVNGGKCRTVAGAIARPARAKRVVARGAIGVGAGAATAVTAASSNHSPWRGNPRQPRHRADRWRRWSRWPRRPPAPRQNQPLPAKTGQLQRSAAGVLIVKLERWKDDAQASGSDSGYHLRRCQRLLDSERAGSSSVYTNLSERLVNRNGTDAWMAQLEMAAC